MHSSPPIQWICVFLELLLLFFPSAPARAQASVDLAIADPAYREIDKLYAFGLVDKIIYSQRPYARAEIARILLDAESHLGRLENQQELHREAQQILKPLQSRFETDIRLFLKESRGRENYHAEFFRDFSAELTFLNSPTRQVPIDNGLGEINVAFINPLVQNQGGRDYPEGTDLFLKFENNFQISPYFAVQIAPYFLLNFPFSDQPNEQKAFLQRMYGKVAIKNLSFTFGRDEVIWGQGRFGGLLLSNNARPLDLFKISGVHPFYHPWVFRHLGPSQYTFFVSNLGPDREFKYSFMVGFAATIQPVKFFELGFYQTYILGGEGAPHLSFIDPISEFFGIRAPGIDPSDPNVADHRTGLNFRLTIPPLRNSQLYTEWVFEDLSLSSLHRFFIDLSAYLVGFYIPRLDALGHHRLRLEYHRTPPFYARHIIFTSGYQLNGNLMGDPLGPDGQGVYLDYEHDITRKDLLGFQAAYEGRDSNLYVQPVENGHPTSLRVLEDRSAEHRFRGIVSWERQWNDLFRTRATLGYERVTTFNFVPGDSRNNFLGTMEFNFDFGRYVRLPNRAP